MTRILVLTDLHVFAQPGALLKGIPTRESLQEVVAHIEQTEDSFDHVIVTGDHTHDEQPESYQAVLSVLQPWRDRLRIVPGNHDDRAVLRSVFGQITEGNGAEPVRFQLDCGDWQMIGLDTHLPGEVSGCFDAAQAEWLKKTLYDSDAESVGIFMHHPPISVNSEWMDAIGLDGAAVLAEIVETDRRIRFLCCGHVHHEFEGELYHATVFTTPSTGIQFDPAGAEPNFAAAAPGYRVIELNGPFFQTRVVRLPQVRYSPVV